jgi:hypothetical protein
MNLSSFFMVIGGMKMVSMRYMGMMSSGLVVTLLVMLGCLAVVFGGLLQMFCGFVMMFDAFWHDLSPIVLLTIRIYRLITH